MIDKQKAIDLRLNKHWSYNRIAVELHCNHETIKQILVTNNCFQSFKKNISDVNETMVVNDRNSQNLSLNQLAEKYKCGWGIIKQILIKNNCYKDTRHATKVNNWDREFFKKKDAIVSYWAGFGFADGCITKQEYGYRYHIIANLKDYPHLELFAKTINYPVDKIYINKTKSCTIQISSHGNVLADSLRLWGIVPRKTYNFIQPEVPKSLIPHFIRGWIDGDGSIRVRSKDQSLQLVGNIDALYWGKEQLQVLGYDDYISIRPKTNKCWGWLCIYGRHHIEKLAYLLMANIDELPKLQRKWKFINAITS